MEEISTATLKDRVEELGYGVILGRDEAYFFPSALTISHFGVEDVHYIVTSDAVRDYSPETHIVGVWPYDKGFAALPPGKISNLLKLMWPQRRVLQRRKIFGTPMEAIKTCNWYEYREVYAAKLRSRFSIAYAEIATHNHFIFNRSPVVTNRTAPLIVLPETATYDDYLKLLGILNSSAACFWLKQVCHIKGGSGIGRGVQDEPWEERYSFNVTRVREFPLPANLPLGFGQELDELGRKLAAVEPRSVCAVGVPTRDQLDEAHSIYNRIRGKMIALQEESDWDTYRRYGLLSDVEASEVMVELDLLPEIKLGERAFEIALARQTNAGAKKSEWFVRHESESTCEIPDRWGQDYRKVVARRIELIGWRPNIGLIERPEYKRRWQSDSWVEMERNALRTWLLDRCERHILWFTSNQRPQSMTLHRLADKMRPEEDVVAVARLLAGSDADLADVISEIVSDQHVPYLARLRYKGEGLLKRALWENAWNLQHEEDLTGKSLDFDVPPDYKKADFVKDFYWAQRDKLDIPKERFISYPGASPDSDDSLLLGWAGWDHREQAIALITLIEERSRHRRVGRGEADATTGRAA